MEPIFLSIDDVLDSHAEQIAAHGGSDGIRDIGLLQSAIAQPEAMFEGRFLHVDLFQMAAAYLFHIVLNHAFIDGNKRVGPDAAWSVCVPQAQEVQRNLGQAPRTEPVL